MPLRVKCPICHREAAWENNPHRPFCSERCQLIDLGAWTEGRYRIPSDAIEDDLVDNEEDDNEKKQRQ